MGKQGGARQDTGPRNLKRTEIVGGTRVTRYGANGRKLSESVVVKIRRKDGAHVVMFEDGSWLEVRKPEVSE